MLPLLRAKLTYVIIYLAFYEAGRSTDQDNLNFLYPLASLLRTRGFEFCTFIIHKSIIMKFQYVLAFGTGLCLASVGTDAQVLNRLKQKVENKTEQKAGN